MVLTCAWISWTCRNKHVNNDEHVTCRCNILWFVVHNYGCDILWENGFCVIYICDGWYIYICIYMKCLCRWNAKNKKKIKFLPLCRGQWLRPSAKKGPLPRVVPLPSAKIHWKNSGTFLCRGPWLETLGKDFFLKKIKISLPRACGEALGKDFF